MSRLPEWLCIDADDPENFLMFRADTEDDALAMAKAKIDSVEEWLSYPVTPQMRRRWRYHERKEAGTLPPRKSLAKPVSPEAQAWYRGLGMMATMGLHDERGRMRCPGCRRYVTLDDLRGSATGYVGGGIAIDFAPSCRRCRGEK